MKTLAILSAAAVVSLGALTGAASANGLVPGSDHYTEVQADYEANTVIGGVTRAPGVLSSTDATTGYGYPVSGSEVGLVPGSRTTTHAEETRDINAVQRGYFNRGHDASARGPALFSIT